MNLFPESRRWAGAAVSAVLFLGAAGCGSADDAVVRAYAATVSGVTEAADAFLATLDADEKKQVLLEFDRDHATAWSNLPCGSTCRPGIKFADLDAEELAAAKSVLKTALGTGSGTGFARVQEILLADDHLGGLQSGTDSGSGNGTDRPGGGAPSGMGMPAPGPAGGLPDGGTPGGGMPGGGQPDGMSDGGRPGGMSDGGMPGGGSSVGAMGGSGYSSGTYFLAFLGTPSTDGTWQLHFGGHHLAVNLTYQAGAVIGATPFFVGVEPATWTVADGTTHAPLDDMRTAMLAMTRSLSAAERAKAKLTQTYTDVLAGPGKDGQFPETKQGLAVGTLSAKQKQLVLAAIKPWVVNADGATAAALMSTYESELDKTYVSWSGTAALTQHADYVRVDGPSVWVEFVCQDGIVIRDKIHYHTVYRDHTRDYGGEFTFS